MDKEPRESHRKAAEAWFKMPYEDPAARLSGTVGTTETVKAIMNARAIFDASQTASTDAKDLVAATKDLVNETKSVATKTGRLVREPGYWSESIW